MAVLETQVFDSLTENQTLSTQNPATAIGGAPWYTTVGAGASMVARAAAAAHGARGLEMANLTGPAQVSWSGGESTTSTHVISAYMRIDTAPSGNCYLMAMTDENAAGATRCDWRISPDLNVTLRNSNVATGGTSDESLSVGVWYRMEWMVGSAGQELRIFEGEATVPIITQTGALTNALHSRFNLGGVSGQNGISLSLDTLRLGDDWVGPFGTPSEPLATPTGFSFVATTGSVQIDAAWNEVSGAASYQVEVQHLVGSNWTALQTFATTDTDLSLNSSDGLVGGSSYRGRVRALPPGA